MPCLCTTNTLRLFIRSVAQVDVHLSVTPTSSKQWNKAAIRNFSSTRATREPRSNSDSKSLSNGDIPFERSPLKAQQSPPESKSWPQGSAEGGCANTDAEVANTSLKSERNSSARKGRSSKDASAAGNQPTIRILRKTKVEDSGFKIHYSSPPAQIPPRKSAPPANPKPQSSDHTKEKGEWTPPSREHWQIDKAALKSKFPEGWKPLKRLSPDALAGIRALHAQDPAQYTTSLLASSFKISPEAIRRILKSKWSPSSEEEDDRQRRWFNRGKAVYTRHAEMGQKPPKKWRDMGIGRGRPDWMVKKRERREMGRERLPLPALVTTARKREAKHGIKGMDESVEDRIL